MSETLTLPVGGLSGLLSVFTINFWNVTEPAGKVAFVERYTPRVPMAGTSPSVLPPLPANPEPVATKIVFGSVGWTRILLIERPLKIL